jgi:hypothetical protein
MLDIKKIILYSLCISTNFSYFVSAQDLLSTDYNDCPEEIYPFQNVDNIFLTPKDEYEIAECKTNLKPTVLSTPALNIITKRDDIENNMLLVDCEKNEQLTSSEVIPCYIDHNQKIISDIPNIELVIENFTQDSKDQLFLSNDTDEQKNILLCNIDDDDDIIDFFTPIECNPLDIQEIIESSDRSENEKNKLESSKYNCENIINPDNDRCFIYDAPGLNQSLTISDLNLEQNSELHNDNSLILDDDDTIIVPHNLINSFKKAEKQRKKLAKKERSAFFKKNKKKK